MEWADEFAELREAFQRESAQRLEELERIVDLLELNQGDVASLRLLLLRFHSIAGAGGTYGFPEITRLGREGERTCVGVLKDRGAVSPEDLDGFRWAIRAIREAFAAGPKASAPEAPTAPPRPRLARDILVVDDEPGARAHLAQLLEAEGLVVRTATSLGEALSAVEAHMPSGFVVDVVLPDGSGFDLVERVRNMPGGSEVPILVISVRSEFPDRVEAIHCGGDGFFGKPVDWEALMRRLQHLMDRDLDEPRRVLSVEDDPSQAAFLRAVLVSAGYEVMICGDPAHFEHALQTFRPDLVLMDVVLPSVSGYDLAKYTRQDERHATLPILFLTNEGELSARIASMKAGGDDYLVKPIPPPLLLSTVASRIERARFVKTLLSRDGLTRLLTHTAFLERARAAVAQARRYPDRSVVWVMIDLDHFKSVNDLYGHPVGDRVLSALGGLLRRRLRQSDTLGRYGGEEFAVLLDDLGEADACRLAGRLLDEFAATEHTASDGSLFHVAFSAGVCALDPRMDLEAWRHCADATLYAAKAAGRGRVLGAGGHGAPAASEGSGPRNP